MTSNRWTIPVLVLIFSLLVGICGKYLSAPNSIRGGMVQVMKGEGTPMDYRTFPGALLTSLFSLLSGASVGPEGPLTTLAAYVAGWLGAKLKIAAQARLGFLMAGVASALDALIGNPLFSAFRDRTGGRRSSWGIAISHVEPRVRGEWVHFFRVDRISGARFKHPVLASERSNA